MPVKRKRYDYTRNTPNKRYRRSTSRSSALARARLANLRRTYPIRLGGYANRPEVKYIDTAIDGTLATIPTVTLINGVAIGDDVTDRIGSKINMISVQVEGFTENALTDNEHDAYRCWIVYDHQTNGALASYTDIFKTAAEPYALRNLQYRDRFTVLWDSKQKSLPAQANSLATPYYQGVTPVHTFLRKFKKFRATVNFKTNTAAIASIASGSLLFVVVSTSSDAGVTMKVRTRVKFTDL